MTFNEIKAYFQNYAAQHKDIGHTADNKAFVAVHTDKSADDFIRTCRKPVICVLITPDKSLFPPKGENYNWDKSICFMILKKSGRVTEEVITNAQNDCETIIDDFVTRIIADRFGLIRSILQESIAIQPVGPVADDFYGQVCMFALVDEFEYLVDSSKWNDL